MIKRYTINFFCVGNGYMSEDNTILIQNSNGNICKTEDVEKIEKSLKDSNNLLESTLHYLPYDFKVKVEEQIVENEKLIKD